jgi:hypothetical protein
MWHIFAILYGNKGLSLRLKNQYGSLMVVIDEITLVRSYFQTRRYLTASLFTENISKHYITLPPATSWFHARLFLRT